jgi:hypothetical protein
VHDYSHVTDDAGNKFDLARDPPALVKQMVAESVRRWQVARVDRTFSSADLGGTLRLAPLAKLLRTSSPLWGPAERAQLHSAIVGGQWTQLRLYRAGRAESPLCVLCGAAHGTMAHRLWWCEHPELAAARRRHVPPDVLARARAECNDGKQARWERALFPTPQLASTRRGPFDTFVWDVEPEGGAAQAVFYPDGSRCGGNDPLVASYGWAFSAFANGRLVAAAHGVPPWWTRSVNTAEVVALARAATASFGASRFRTDCLAAVQVHARGRSFATGAKQLAAEAWRTVFGAIGEDDVPDDDDDPIVSWIPAHTASAHVGISISAEDRAGNDDADVRAKSAASAGAPSAADAAALRGLDELITTVGRWIGRAGVLTSAAGLRDTEASQAGKRSRRAAAAAAAASLPAPQRAPRDARARPYALGGHALVRCDHGWRCAICRVSSATWGDIASKQCQAGAAAQSAFAAAAAASDDGRPHTRWISDGTIWCSTCGQYATDAIVGLRRGCHPIKAGTRHQRRLLCSGVHPGTRRPFDGVAIPEHAWQSHDELAAHAIVAPDLRRAAPPRGNVVASRVNAAAAGRGGRDRLSAPSAPPVLSERLEALRQRVAARQAVAGASSTAP